jgi:hypothetical protein
MPSAGKTRATRLPPRRDPYHRSVPSLIECVPNFSEGRRPEVLDEITRAIRQIEGVTLLDASRDESHNRSVVTFAGGPEQVVRAAMAAVGRALELIDMEQQSGAHPRIGSVDVIPFVPLGGTRMDECVDLARRFGEQVAKVFELPVYLYGEAALRPERRRLAEIRRGQYEALKEEIGVNPDRAGRVARGSRSRPARTPRPPVASGSRSRPAPGGQPRRRGILVRTRTWSPPQLHLRLLAIRVLVPIGPRERPRSRRNTDSTQGC